MSSVVKFENLKNLIVELRGQSILLDSDVAELYKVETKRVNEAVKNNPDKFPHDYMFEISEEEFGNLRSKFSTAKFAKTRVLPKAFTEKGLYMIATILKSKQATEATFAIIETFSKIRQLSKSIQELSIVKDKADRKALMQKSGELIAGIFDDDLQTNGTETSIELNFAVLKFKHTISKKKKLRNNE
ncbi:MAG: ORF6N domain-containing protein [Proteobacteria bacterium]|nr:ORF6N domain-containing protein [Pseudomonadota bacterium]